MTYLLVVLGLVGAFVWASPSKVNLRGSLGDATRAAVSTAGTYLAPVADKGAQLLSSLRGKAKNLLRKELHDAVDAKLQ